MNELQWVAQVTEVELRKSYENGDYVIQGAEVTAELKFEYNGVSYNGTKEVKTL